MTQRGSRNAPRTPEKGHDAADGRTGNAQQEQEIGERGSKDEEVARYTEAADQERLAEQAIQRLAAWKCLTWTLG